jgi:acid stress chaperone HdeB
MFFRSTIIAIALGVFTTSNSHGQVMIDVTKVTCEQFYYSKVSHPTTLSIWLSGYYHGKRDKSVVDVQNVKENAEKVQKFCRQQANHKVPLMDAAERVLGKQ